MHVDDLPVLVVSAVQAGSPEVTGTGFRVRTYGPYPQPEGGGLNENG